MRAPGYASLLTCLKAVKNTRDKAKLTAATMVSAPETVVKSIKSPINTMAIGPNPNSSMYMLVILPRKVSGTMAWIKV